MVEQQLRAMGLKVRGPGRPRIHPLPPEDDVRCPTGRPPACKPGWERYLISTKRCCDGLWPCGDQSKIALAQRRRDEGTHTMTQSVTKDGWIFLYSVPR